MILKAYFQNSVCTIFNGNRDHKEISSLSSYTKNKLSNKSSMFLYDLSA